MSKIDIPYGVWYVYSNAFAYCNSVQSITIPSSVTFIDSGVFNGCYVSTDNFVNYSSLVDDNYWGAKIYDYETGDGLMIKDNKVVSCRQDVRAVNIPEGIIAIEDYAFSYCKSLVSVTIPNSVYNIGEWAFAYCTLLQSITLPREMTNLGASAFIGCSSLESIEIGDNISTIKNGTFAWCVRLKNITIGNSVKEIDNYAFEGCINLTSIDLPLNLLSIGNYTFGGCQSLTEIVIPKSVQSIGTQLFSGCGSLTSIIVESDNSIYDSRNDCNAIIETKTNTLIAGCQTTLIPSDITSIESYAFSGCDGLTTIEFPNSIKSIGENAISSCNSLQSIFVGPNPAYCSSYAFNGIYSSCKLYVPKGYKYSYLYQNEWSKFDNIVEYAQQGDVEFVDNLLYLEDCDFYYGTQYTVPVMMKNERENITAFSFELQLPEGLNVAKDEAGNYMISLVEDRKTATHGVSAVQDDNGLLKVAVYSVMNRPLVGTEGAVLNITFDLDETLAVGKHPLSLQEVVMTCTSGYELATLSYKASVNLHDHSLGDVNHDGSVSITDAIGIINLYLNTDTEGLYVEAADINRDGKVNITDAVWVIDMILNDTGSLAPKRAAKREEGTLTMQFDDICIGQERYVELPVFLRSSSDDITAMQAVLNLPTGVHLDDVIGSGNHQVAWNAQPDGSVRLLSLSLKNECFDSESAVVVLQLRCDASFSSGYVNMNDIELATRSLNGIEMPALSAAISREPNVIEQVRKDADCASDLYDLQGRRAQGSYKGDVMIENGKVKIMK